MVFKDRRDWPEDIILKRGFICIRTSDMYKRGRDSDGGWLLITDVQQNWLQDRWNEFIQEEIRMCASYQDCTKCPLYDTAYCSVSPKKRTKEEAEEIVLRVMKWAEEHPVKTRQSVFLEQWPNAEIDCQGVIKIDPCDLDSTTSGKDGDCYHNSCDECRLDFWMQEVE